MSVALLVAGLAFGDESKGATVDKLCRALPVDLIVRYNGGCQCEHNVVTPDGKHHTFSQFGSGMLANDHVKTYLSRFMLVEPLSMMREAEALAKLTPNVWERIAVDARAVIITPFHRLVNQLREQVRGDRQHGSTGRGIGVAREMHLKYGDAVLFAGDLLSPAKAFKKLEFILETLFPEMSDLRSTMNIEFSYNEDARAMYELIDKYKMWPANIVNQFEPAEYMVFEGAQGVMLDERHGTAPHNTWTNTTFGNADTLLDEAGVSQRIRIGCIRSYYTRHGAGPFPTEDVLLNLPETHNSSHGFAGVFRVGRFDWELLDKAISICGGIHCFAVSHLDCLHDALTESQFIGKLRRHAPICMYGRGVTADDRAISTRVLEDLVREPLMAVNV